jgi:hypothetical protein
MGYEVALAKAWTELKRLGPEEIEPIKFLGDTYEIDLDKEKVFSLSCNALASDFTTILILHYLAKKLRGLPPLTGQWLSFRELSGLEGYLEAYHRRAVEPIIRKYGVNPEGLLSAQSKLTLKKIDIGDVGVTLEAFIGVPVLITLYKADEEFGPEANVLFDRSIREIFCIEDIVVLAGMVASRI